MSFAVAGDVYDRFVGRYSRLLAPRFLDFAGVVEGPVLDVGAGPGALTSVLAGRFGAASVSAVEPSEPFAAACRARVPGVDVRVAPAEALPFAGLSFSASLSQLVLSFVTDAGKAATEMTRVVRRGGTVAACTFEADGFALARTFWKAARRFDPGSAGRRPPSFPPRRGAHRPVDGDRAAGRHAGRHRHRGDVRGIRGLLGPLRARGRAPGRLAGPAAGDQAGGDPGSMPGDPGPSDGPFSLPARVLAIRGRT